MSLRAILTERLANLENEVATRIEQHNAYTRAQQQLETEILVLRGRIFEINGMLESLPGIDNEYNPANQ